MKRIIKRLEELDRDLIEKLESSRVFKLASSLPLWTPSFKKYNEFYYGDVFKDESLVLMEGDNIVGFCPLNLYESVLSYFNSPAKIFIDDTIPEEVRAEHFNFFIKHILNWAALNAKHILLDYTPEILGKVYCSNPAILSEYVAKIDLTQDYSSIMKDVRKSYRSLINWGKKNLDIIRIDSENPSEKLFEQFRKLHIQVAGRETRSKESWYQQFEMIKKGNAFALMACLKGELKAAQLIIHTPEEAIYAVGAYDRELMANNVPLSHSMIMTSIDTCIEFGVKSFVLGDLSGFNDPKLESINKFKKGFCSNLYLHNSLKIDLKKYKQVNSQRERNE